MSRPDPRGGTLALRHPYVRILRPGLVRPSPLRMSASAEDEGLQRLVSLPGRRYILVGGKGGVGKSTVSAQLAFTLASQGKHVRGGAHNLMHTGTSRACSQVGLLDVDICGPSIPRMLGLSGREVHQSGSGWSPVWLDDNRGVMSIGFVLPATDDAVIWRGPRKSGTCRDPCVGLAVFAWRPMAGWS